MKKEHSLAVFVVVILLVGFLSSFRGTPISGEAVRSTLQASNPSCSWDGTSFQACMDVSWSSEEGSYAKPYFTSGTPVNDVESRTEQSFRYCDDVSVHEGIRGGGVYLYSSWGSVASVRKDLSVRCTKQRASPSTFEKTIVFSAWRTGANSQSRAGTEVVEVELPRAPTSCRLEGTWKTDNTINDPARRRNTRPAGYCHAYTGSFVSIVDASEQYVISDPDSFRLAGGGQLLDLIPYRADGYVLHSWLCDTGWFLHDGRRYYVRGFVPDFGKDNVLRIELEYLNDDTRPLVDFTVHVSCDLEKTAAPPQQTSAREPEPLQPSPEEFEAFSVDTDVVPPSTESPTFVVKPLSFFDRLTAAARGFLGGWRGV